MKFFFSTLILLAIYSCSSQKIEMYTQNFDRNTWNKFHAIEFKLPVLETGIYKTSVGVTLSKDFEYSDIKIQYEKNSPDGESTISYHSIPTTKSELVKIEELEDGSKKIEMVIFEKEAYKMKGDYSFVIENMMPKFETTGIKSMEFKIEKQ